MKVTKLEVVTKSQEHNKQVIEILESMLKGARNGEIVELVAICKLSDGLYEDIYSGCESLFTLIGMLEKMKLVTLRRMDQEEC